jgi:hypothetical protein
VHEAFLLKHSLGLFIVGTGKILQKHCKQFIQFEWLLYALFTAFKFEQGKFVISKISCSQI